MEKIEEKSAASTPEHWCMLTVRPGKEAEARDAFRQYGLRAYWPNFTPFTKWQPGKRDRVRSATRSVMPGYLFVAGPTTSVFWDVIERTKGILNVIRNYSGDLATIRNADVEVIREIERSLNTPVPGKALHHFKTGDKVRFVDDLLNRWPPGRVAGSTNDGRIVVEVEVMGRLVPFQVFVHQIEAA